MTEKQLRCYATTSRGIEPVLRNELKTLGADDLRILHSGVGFTCTLPELYSICLESRTANRVLLEIGRGRYREEEDIYRFAASFSWEEEMEIASTFSVTASTRDHELSNASYIGLRVKDGIADRFRLKTGARPSVDSEKPDIAFHLHAEAGELILYLDASGGSLHQRGYRRQTVEAGLKEHVAAAMLLQSNWKELAGEGKALIDPMCGGGTIPIEGALIAYGIAPGIYRRFFGFYHWKGHNREVWSGIRGAARDRLEEIKRMSPRRLRIDGFDKDPAAVAAARANAQSAGLAALVEFQRKGIHEHGTASGLQFPAAPGPGSPEGLVCMNPPYGIRLEDSASVPVLYQEIGRVLKRRYPGWTASVLVPDAAAGRQLGLQADSVSALSNGEIHGKLIRITLSEDNAFRIDFPFYKKGKKSGKVESHAGELKNRLEKNSRRISSYLKKNNVGSYRIYDADIPEYSAAIDIYDRRFVYIQEYQPPAEIPQEKARFRLIEIIAAVSEVFSVPKENTYVTQRRRQRGTRQYDKQGNTGSFIEVGEGGLRFLVNFTDYLDTGLFLEHRELRSRIRAEARDKRFLNLYAYTGTASVYAAAGGAAETVSIDTNAGYLSWAKRNILLNNLSPAVHTTVKSDCMSWLLSARKGFDIIFADPPSFSNSKDRSEDFILERDYKTLLTRCFGLLNPGGTIYFTTHMKKFIPDFSGIEGLQEGKSQTADLSSELTPPDFKNGKGSYACFAITKGH